MQGVIYGKKKKFIILDLSVIFIRQMADGAIIMVVEGRQT